MYYIEHFCSVIERVLQINNLGFVQEDLKRLI